MIDLTKEFNKLIKENNDTILVRHNTTKHCTCWRKETATPDPDCPNCLGGGFIFKEYIRKCKLFKLSGDIIDIYIPIDTDTYYIRKDDIIFELWTNPDGSYMRDFMSGNNILKRFKYIVIDTEDNHSEQSITHFKKIQTRLIPSTM